jgi:hypothetical protein
MAFRSMLMGAVVLAATGAAGAQAQMADFPPVGQQAPPTRQQASPVPGSPGAGPGFSGFGQPQKPPCYDEFMALRTEVDKRFAAVKGKSGKGSASEMCTLLTRFGQSQTALLKFIEPNMAKCGFPPDTPDNIKAGISQTEGYRKQACTAAAAPKARPPSEPTLSDALSAPTVGKDNTRTGRGTLDSLYGNPLAR